MSGITGQEQETSQEAVEQEEAAFMGELSQ